MLGMLCNKTRKYIVYIWLVTIASTQDKMGKNYPRLFRYVRGVLINAVMRLVYICRG